MVETPRGSTCKLDFDPELRAFTLAKPLMDGLACPYDWGFIPSTKATCRRMAKNLPAEESAKLQLSESLSVGAIYDAEFNGFVHRCEPGFAICVPTGALMLISFAAELYCLNATLGFQNVIIAGDILSAVGRIGGYIGQREPFNIVGTKKCCSTGQTRHIRTQVFRVVFGEPSLRNLFAGEGFEMVDVPDLLAPVLSALDALDQPVVCLGLLARGAPPNLIEG